MGMFPVIDLSGGAFERGRLHGERGRGRVERSLANYRRLFAFYGLEWPEVLRRAGPYRDVIGGFDAPLLEEIEGIARGAGRPVVELLALNARTEILQLNRPAVVEKPYDTGECTAIAVGPAGSTTGETLLAQNWDWIEPQREALVLLRVPEDGAGSPACLTLTEAGMLAKIGLNTRGFGVCLNILRSVYDGGQTGVPVHVLLRALLRCASVQEAVALSSTLAFGASSNVLCADRGGEVAALEVSPKGLRVVRGEGAWLCHTNHFLDPEATAWQEQLAANFSSAPRLARARELAGAQARLGVEDIQRIFRDETQGALSICRKPDRSLPAEAQSHTVASVVMELARGVMHVAPDEPSRAAYQPVSLAPETVAA
jgi:isopenicillin-N N-acyltransferase-like protein